MVQESPLELQLKPIFESNAEPPDDENTQPAIKTKLTIGQPNDKYEKEADAVADKVVQRLAMPDVLTKKETGVQTKPLAAIITPIVQRKCADCEQEEKLQKKHEEDLVQESPLELQLKPIFESNAEPNDDENNAIQKKYAECEKEDKIQKKPGSSDSQTTSSNIESNINSSKGSGSTIPVHTKEQMEDSFGADFSNVRIHTDSSAVQMSKDLHAQAFAHGSDIYFNAGKYDINSGSGKHLLAHELTHTLQQAGSSKIIQNSPEDYITSNIPQSPLYIIIDDNYVYELLDVKYADLKGNSNYPAHEKAREDINIAVRAGLENENKNQGATAVIVDENEALINQLGSNSLTEASGAVRKLIRMGLSGWKSLLLAMNHDLFEIRLWASTALQQNIKSNRKLLLFIVNTVETNDGVLKVSAMRVLNDAGFGKYYDNKAFCARVIQKLEFIKIFFSDLPVPKDGPYQTMAEKWYTKTKAEVGQKVDSSVSGLQNEITLWKNIADIAQVVEIFQSAMAVVSRVIAFMRMFDTEHYTIHNQEVYHKLAYNTMSIGDSLNYILSIEKDMYQTTARPTVSLVGLKTLFTVCEQIPKAIATGTVKDLGLDLYKVERDSLELVKALKDAEPPDWRKHVETSQKIIGTTNGIQSTLPQLSKLAWEKPLVYFDVWNSILQHVGEMLNLLDGIGFALNAHSLVHVIDDSWQLIDKRSDTAKQNKAILTKYLKAADALILQYIDDPKNLGLEIEKLRVQKEYKEALDWAEKFSVEEQEHREIVLAVVEIALTLASIWAGGVAGRIAAFGLRAFATTGAVGAAVAGNVVVRGGLILGAETLGFVVTEKTLHQLLFGKGNWDSFLSDYVKAYLLFGVLKGTGRLYEGLIASGRIPYGLAKIAQFGTEVGTLTAMQGVFIAWENLHLDPDKQKDFNLLEQLLHNALFLSLVKIGMVGLNKFPASLLARLDKKAIEMMDARSKALETKLAEIKDAKSGQKEYKSLHKEIKNLLEARKDALIDALRNDAFKGNEVDIAATKATIQAIENRISEINSIGALFKFNIQQTELDYVFTFEGDPAELKVTLEGRSTTGVTSRFERVQDAKNSEIYKYQVANQPPIYLEKVTKGAKPRLSPSEVAKMRGISWTQAVDAFWKAVQEQNFKYDFDFIGNVETNIRIKELIENGWRPGQKLPKEVGQWLEKYYAREKPSESEMTKGEKGSEGTAEQPSKTFEERLAEAWTKPFPPRLNDCIKKLRKLNVPEDTILDIIRNAGNDPNPNVFFGNLNTFLKNGRKIVGEKSFATILEGLSNANNFRPAKLLMTAVANGQNIEGLTDVLPLEDVAKLYDRASFAKDADFIKDLKKMVDRVKGSRDDIFTLINEAGTGSDGFFKLKKALDRLGQGKFTPQQIRVELEFGIRLEEAISAGSDEAAKTLFKEHVTGKNKTTGKFEVAESLKDTKPGDRASKFVRDHMSEIEGKILEPGGKEIDLIKWGVIKDAVEKTDLPTVVKNDIIGEVWASAKIKAYKNQGFNKAVREVHIMILDANGKPTGRFAKLDAVLFRGAEMRYKEFKASETAELSGRQQEVYDKIKNEDDIKDLMPFGDRAEEAFGKGMTKFKSQEVEIERPK